jgi:hypothetical protein
VAQNEAVFAIRITDNGTLQIVQKDAKKAAAGLNDLGAAVDRTAESQNNFNRGQKGVIGATANGTKSFSKMRDAIGGSSGLVGAYATLAANVFALSAAFNALSRASKVDQLTKSIAFLSASSGDNLKRISENLVEVTGNAISMADAMKSASFGTSAGFDSTQLETLAKVAKGASAALGRDLNDSFDRLTRGAAKLEPEILDELGIIVRIDKATQDYANAIGKNVKELSAWERQQAFVNAINTQGIKKYGELADSIQASPFDKLAAAATNASNASLKFVVEALKLPALLDYIAENTTALAGVVIAFAGTITRQMLPAVYKIPEALARVADKAAIQSFEKLKTSLSGITGGLGPSAKKAVGDFVSKLEDGTASAEDLKFTQDKLARSLSSYNTLLKDAKGNVEKLTNELKQLTSAEIKDAAAIAAKTQDLNEATAAQQRYTAAVATTEQAQTQVDSSLNAQNNALAKNKIASGVAAIGAWNFISGWKEVVAGVKGSMIPLSDATSAWGELGIAGKNALTGIAAGASALFATALTLISIIGVITALFPGLQKWFMNSFFPEKESEKKARALEEVSSKVIELTDHISNVESSITVDVKADKLDSTIEGITRFTGVLREISAVIASTYENLRAAFAKVIDEAGRADARVQLLQNKMEERRIRREAAKENIDLSTPAVATQQTDVGTAFARALGGGSPIAETTDQAAASLEAAAYSRKKQLLTQLDELRTERTALETTLQDFGEQQTTYTAEEVPNELRTLVEKYREVQDSLIVNRADLDAASRTAAKTTLEDTANRLTMVINSKEATLQRLREEVDQASKKINEADVATYSKKIQKLETELEALKSAPNKDTQAISAKQQEIVDAKATDPRAERERAVQELTRETQALQNAVIQVTTATRAPWEDTIAQLKQVSDNAGNLSKVFDNFAQKNEGRFGPLIEALSQVSIKIKSTGAEANALNAILGEAQGRAVAERLKGASVQGLLSTLQKGQAAEAQLPGLKIDEQNATKLVSLFPTVISFEQQRVKASEQRLNAEVTVKNAEIEALKIVGASEDKISATIKERDSLQQSLIENAYAIEAVNLRIEQQDIARLKVAEEIAQITAENAKSEQALANYKKTGKLDLTISQQIKNIKHEPALKKRSLELEKTAQISTLQFERIRFKILLDRLILEGKINAEQAAEAQTGIKAIDAQIAAQKELFDLKEKAIGLGEATQLAQIAQANAPSRGITETSLPTGGQAFDAKSLVTNAQQAGADVIAAAEADIAAKMATATAGSAEMAALEERLKRITEGGDPLVNFRAGLAQAQVVMTPFIASMKELGPEGALVASVAEGGLAIANSWSQAAETIKGSGDAMEKGAAIAQAAGATLGAISQILQANSNANIAAIDSQIAAEQKRDGKSKESLAKIAALEKKKEAEKKKAFEMNKKMQMAQTIVNTASAMMSAIAELGPIAGPIMAAAFAAMGAAQLAIIAGTSYQGGGASSAAGVPSSIAIGQRTSSIDLAKSKSASGELSYLQGAQGMGGPEAFTPAFTGMKYRASGGATTGFMVGEQGPELFIPDRPGTIVPADQTANMGGVTNVNFSISAIDTQGVEDMLENQKGAIINMIRSAANSYGQPFIEQVDTSVYRPAPKSRTYRR